MGLLLAVLRAALVSPLRLRVGCATKMATASESDLASRREDNKRQISAGCWRTRCQNASPFPPAHRTPLLQPAVVPADLRFVSPPIPRRHTPVPGKDVDDAIGRA